MISAQAIQQIKDAIKQHEDALITRASLDTIIEDTINQVETTAYNQSESDGFEDGGNVLWDEDEDEDNFEDPL